MVEDLFHADGRTRMTKLIIVFRDLVIETKNSREGKLARLGI
jgi:hypothetical protein